MKKLYLALILVFIFASSCTLVKTLYYNKADIDDHAIFKYREVKTGEHQEWELSENYNKNTILSNYIPIILEYETASYLVVHKGKILHEEYWGKYNKDSYTNSFSMSKSFVSLLIGFAIDDGVIKGVDQKAADFLDYFKESDKANISIKDLLTMSSSLNWKESYNSPFGNTAKSYYGKNLEKIIKKLPADSIHGEKFAYSSGDTQILALIIEKATGKSLSDYMSEKLWQALGTKHIARWSIDKKDGHEKAFCCFNSNARDFAKIGQFILQTGKWNGKQLLSESYIKESLAPATHIKFGEKPVEFYGYQWWMIKHKEMDVKFARGLFGQYIFIIPEKDLVIVRLGHKRSSASVKGVPADVLMWLDIAFEMI